MLFKTTKTGKSKASHYHVVFVAQNGTGITSTDREHNHIFSDGVIDNMEKHTHELIPVPLKVDKDSLKVDKDEDQSVRDVRALYDTAKEYEKDYREKAKESEGYYDGTAQWANIRTGKSDQEMKTTLESKDRAALTINEIESKIDLLSGYLRQNRTDIRYFPIEGGDSKVADILNIVVKNITEQNNFEYEETEEFEDGLITGRGLISVRVDFEDNIEGDIVIEQDEWENTFFGPHNKKDLRDCEYYIKTKWLSWARIKQMWPEKADAINIETELYQTSENKHATYADDQYKHSKNKIDFSTNADFVDVAKKEYRVLELHRKVYNREHIAVNRDAGFSAVIPSSDASKVKTLPGFFVISRVKTNQEIILIAGNTRLESKIDKYFDKNFPCIPFYVKKRRKNIWGKVESAKDPQQEINKRHSQAVDIMNKVATYGHYYDEQTFPTPKDREHFRKNHTSPGFLSKLTDVNRPPAREDGVRFPSELVAMMDLDSRKIMEIMNINLELSGRQSNANSGIAIAERKRQGLTGNEFVFDNLSLSKKLLGRTLVKLIQKLYPPERLLRLLESRKIREQIEIGGKQFIDAEQLFNEITKIRSTITPEMKDQEIQEINGKIKQLEESVILRGEIEELLAEADLTKYDVVAAESASNPTTRSTNFMIWSELAKTRQEIPLTLLVEMSDLPDKEKAIAAINQSLAARAAEEQKKSDTEIQKTLIAKGDNGV